MARLSNLPPGVTDRMIEEQQVRELRKAVAFEFEDCGVEHAQYFQGRGTAHTKWDIVYLGTGCSLREAYDSALENAAQACDYFFTKKMLAEMEKEVAEASDDLTVPDDPDFAEDVWHYAALYLR